MLTNTKEGICQTCRHASSCALASTSPGVSMQCEEYELAGSWPPPVPVQPRPAPRHPSGPAAAEPDLMGLCQNCRLRSGCRLPRPEGGIWFCEEYEVE